MCILLQLLSSNVQNTLSNVVHELKQGKLAFNKQKIDFAKFIKIDKNVIDQKI